MRFTLRGWQTKGRWPASWVLIAATILWFLVIQTLFGHTASGYLHSGALAGVLVENGQWFRLFSSIFVHLNTLHILVNMVSLWSLTVVETLMGTNFFVVAYLLSGVIGNLLSMVFAQSYVISAGASGAIFGLFGCMLGLAYLRVLPSIVRNQLLLILIVNIVMDVTHSGIDWLAHLGGMIVGFLLTLLYTRAKTRPLFWRVGAILLGVFTGVSLTMTLCIPLSTIT